MKLTQETKVDILLGLFVASLVAANLLGGKITTILGISVSVGIFAYPLSFLVTDMIEEVFGKQKTKRFILAGFSALVLVLILTLISVAMPAADRYPYNEAYVTIFNSSIRMIIASFVAFLLSQFHDIWAFNFWKKKTKGRLLWLRNNLSTMVSQFIDTTIFMFIAFYGITPKFTTAFIFSLIIPYWIFKIVFALIDTPFVYLGVKWLRRGE
jgi:uncharacterized integral membrane protein (TIGR00697 family)